MKCFFKRILYFLKHGKDDYGKPGFEKLFYKGKEIKFRNYVPKSEIWFVDDDNKVTSKLNIETEVLTTYIKGKQ